MALPGNIKLNGATSATIAENIEIGAIVGVLTAEDGDEGDEITGFALAEPSDFFEIVQDQDSGEWQLKLKASVDYETLAQRIHTLKIEATSTNETSTETSEVREIAVTVANVNEAPTDISLSAATVMDNAATGTVIGDLAALDPDLGETFSFMLENSDGAFKIVDGKLVVADGSKLDFETASSRQVEIKVTDSGSLSFTKTFNVAITDGVDPIVGTRKNDKLVGTNGDDIINGGLGKDKLKGLDGKDTFVFDTPVKKGHFDHILDFKPADDTIQIALSSIKSLKMKGLNKGLSKGMKKGSKKDSDVKKEHKLPKKFFKVGDKPKDANDYVYYNKKNGFVYLDSDGSGGKKGIAIVKVKPGTALAADDFLFV